jgi:hypothetical protein
VTCGKPIAVLLQAISGVRAIIPLVAFNDIHGGKTEVLFIYFVPDTTRDCFILCYDNSFHNVIFIVVDCAMNEVTWKELWRWTRRAKDLTTVLTFFTYM